jgi:hypothetical protein
VAAVQPIDETYQMSDEEARRIAAMPTLQLRQVGSDEPLQLTRKGADKVADALVVGMTRFIKHALAKQEQAHRKQLAEVVERFEIRARELRKRTEHAEDRADEIQRDLGTVLRSLELIEQRMAHRGR